MSVEMIIVSAALIVVAAVVVLAQIVQARAGVDALMAHIEGEDAQSKQGDVKAMGEGEFVAGSSAAGCDSGVEDLRSLTEAVGSHTAKPGQLLREDTKVSRS